MLALVATVVALRLDRPFVFTSPLAPQRLVRLPRPQRRAPLAEHGWESRVLCNLTKSEF